MSARLNVDAAFFYLAFSLIPGKAAQTKPSQVFLLLRPWWMGNNFNEISTGSCLEISFLRCLDFTKSEAYQELAQLLHPSDYLIFLAAITPDKGRGIDPLLTNIKIASTVNKAIETVKFNHAI